MLSRSDERVAFASRQTLEQLRALCSCEMSAVLAYDQALDSELLTRFAPLLRRCRRSHQERIYLLSRRIEVLGGSPPAATDDWSVLLAGWAAEGVENVENDAVSRLEYGEEHAVREYRARRIELDADSRELVERQLFPAQNETHTMMRALKRELRVAQAQL